MKAAQKAAAFQDHDETVVVKEKMVGGIAQVSWAALMGQGWLWLPPQPLCACLRSMSYHPPARGMSPESLTEMLRVFPSHPVPAKHCGFTIVLPHEAVGTACDGACFQ